MAGCPQFMSFPWGWPWRHDFKTSMLHLVILQSPEIPMVPSLTHHQPTAITMIPSIPSQRLCTFCGTGLSGRVFGCLGGSFRVIFVFVEMLPAGSAGSKERIGLWVMWDSPNSIHRSILADLYHPWKWWNWGLFIYGIGFATAVLWVPSGSFW